PSLAHPMLHSFPTRRSSDLDRKTAAPAIERVERSYGREQTDPDQAPNQIDICLQQQRVEEIDPSRVTKMIADHVDRIGWPKPDAVGEKVDVSDVKTEIAQVHRRLNFEFSSVDKKQPAK